MEQNSLTTKFLEDLLRSGGDLAFPASMEASSLAPTGAPLISLYSYLWHIMRYKWIDNWLSGVSELWTIAVAAEVTQEHRKNDVKKERNVEIYKKYDPGTIQGYCRLISGRMLWLWTGEKALVFVFVFVFIFLCRQSWGHRRNMQLKDVLSMDELIETLVITVRW